MKGQIFEMMGFVILAVAVIVTIVMMRVYLVSSFGKAYISVAERQTIEETRAGVTSLFFMTEEKSGKSMQELIGIASVLGDTKINFGPVVGEVDVAKELEWRMNAMYGRGKWFIRVPYPTIAPDIQIVFVIDTSASLCDDIEELSIGLPNLIERLESIGKKVSATIYLLAGGAPCCNFTIACDKFPESDTLHCMSISRGDCSDVQTDEDWGNGLVCAIKEGPKEGWEEFSVKLGIPISDEVPLGSECLGANYCCANNPNAYRAQYVSLQNGIKSAVDNSVFIFPIKANTCGTICLMQGTTKRTVFTSTQCDCSNLVTSYMTEIATKTGGKMYSLREASDIIEAINDIVESINPKRKPQLEIGTQIPITKNVRAVNAPIAVPSLGVHTVANIYVWA